MSPCLQKNRLPARSHWAMLVGFLLVFSACDTDSSDTLFDPNAPFDPDPVISSVAPADSALAGVSVVTITGQNFSSTAGENLVYFAGTRANILSASSSELQVLTPNQPAESVTIRVAVIGAENFSNSVAYKLNPAAESFGNVGRVEEPAAIATDADGNAYVSMLSNGVPDGIHLITPDGARSDYISSSFRWTDLAFGPDGYLYAVRGVRASFRFPPGGGAQETWAVIADRSVRLTSITFDDAGNAWVGGANQQIFRIAPDQSIEAFDFVGDVTAMTVHNGFLYVGVDRDGVNTVDRIPVDGSGNPGTPETFFSISDAVGDLVQGNAIAFAASGELFIGTDLPDPILLVQPDATWEFLYPGVLEPSVFGLAWGPDPFLYVSRVPTQGTTADIVRINTQREGAR